MITELANAIITQIQTDVPGLQSCLNYFDFDKNTQLPAFLVETDPTFKPAMDAGTEQLCLTVGWRGYCVYDPLVSNAHLEVRDLVLTVTHAIYKASRFGLQIGAAKITQLREETTKVELVDHLTWVVEWTHDVRIGDSVWDGVGVIPTEVYFSYEPDAVPLGSTHTRIE